MLTHLTSKLPDTLAHNLGVSFVATRVDRLFGYDFFISYARKDKGSYASSLKKELEWKGYRCFLDEEGFGAGDSLGTATHRILRKTTALILIGSSQSLQSQYVYDEVNFFSQLGRKIIPIDINRTLENAGDSYKLRVLLGDRIRIQELTGSAESDPSKEVIGAVLQSFNSTRRDTKRIQAFAAVAVVFALVAAIATALAFKANAASRAAEERRVEADTQRAEADRQREMAELKTIEALSNAEEAKRQATIAEQRRQAEERQQRIAHSQTLLAKQQSRVAEEKQQIALARQLAAQSESLRNEYTYLSERGLLLAVESLRRASSLQGFQALHGGLALMPRVLMELNKHKELRQTALSPDGRYLAIVDANKIQVLEVSGHRKTWEATTESWVENITFIPNGRGLITVDGSDTVKVWSFDHDRPVQEFKGDWRYADQYPTPIAVSPDGKWVASRSQTDNKVRVWNIEKGELLASFQHRGPITAITFSSDGKYVVSAASSELKVWEAVTGYEVGSADSNVAIVRIAVNEDATSLVTAEANISSNLGIDKRYSVKEWHRFANQLQMDHDLENVFTCYSIALSSTGRLVATAASNGAIQIWIRERQLEIARLPGERHAFGASMGQMHFNVDENRLSILSTRFNPQATVYEFGNISSGVDIQGKGTAKVFDKGERRINIDPNNTVQVSEPTRRKGIWEKWLASNRQILAGMNKRDEIMYIAFSPDGKFIAIARGHSTTIWQTNDSKEIARLSYELSGDMMEPGMYYLAFSPDSKYIATVDAIHNRIWEVNTGREIARIEKEAYQRSVSFSQDGRYLVLGNHLWAWQTDDLVADACSRLTRNLTPDEWRQYLGDEPFRKTCLKLP